MTVICRSGQGEVVVAACCDSCKIRLSETLRMRKQTRLQKGIVSPTRLRKAKKASRLAIVPSGKMSASFSSAGMADSAPGSDACELARELRLVREYFQTVVERLEAKNVELESSNEKLISAHEDLKSSNEKLVAANIILQSKVDELTSANDEIKCLVENARVDVNSYEMLSGLFDNAPIGIQIFDKHGFSQRMNEAHRNLLGLSHVTTGVGEFNVLTDPFVKANGQYETFRQAYAGETTSPERHEINLSVNENNWQTNQSVLCIEQVVVPVKDRAGDVIAVAALVQDATARKHAESMLQRERNRLGAILEAVGDPIFVKDNEHRIILANRAFYEIFGLSEDAVIGKTLAEHVPEDERAHFLAVDRKVLDTGETDLREETLTVDGFTRTIITKKTRLVEEGGEKFIIGSIHDITNRKRAEELLRESEEKFASIFHYSPVMMAISDAVTGRGVDVNQEHIEISGYTHDEWLEKTLLELNWIGAEEWARLMHELETQGWILAEEINVRAKDGRLIPVIYSGFFIETNGRRHIVSLAHDISAIKQAKEALREIEKLYQQMFNDHAAVQILIDPETIRIVGANDAACRFYGYSADVLQGMTMDQINTLPTDEVIKVTRGAAASHANHLFFRHRLASGELRDVEVYTTPVNLKGKVVMYSIIHDITDRKRAEEALRENEARLSSIYETVGDVIFQLQVEGDEKYRFGAINPAFCRVTGLSQEMVVGKMVHEVIPEPSLSMVLEKYRQAIEEGRTVRWEETSDYPTGRLVGEVSIVPVFAANGKCSRLVGSVHDITERKRAEEVLRESEKRTQNILNTMLDGGQIIGHDWRYLYLNDAAVAHSGRNCREELLGFTLMEKYPGIETTELFGILSQCMTERTPRRIETQFFFPDGTNKWFDLTIQPVPEGLFILSCDITERKRMAAERQAREQQLLEDQRLQSLGLLTGGVAHDINNVLTPIWTNVELLRLKCGNEHETNELFDSIVAATQRARDLVRQMLAFAGRHPMCLAPVDLNDLIAENQTLLRASLPKNVTIQLDPAPEPLPLIADRTQLHQVVMNLIINATDAFAGRAGQIFVSTRRQPSASVPTEEEVVLVVRDTGPGIAPENLPRIFDPFFTTKSTGYGLGLSATQGIIRAHRGQLEVRSVLGEGTTFTIRLPLNTQDKLPSATPPPDPPLKRLASEGVWLVIDDEALVRKSTCRVLRLLKLQTLEAEDGVSGLALAREYAAELAGVVLDLTMPGMNGRELFYLLREEFPTVPVLFVSGYSLQEVQDLVTLPKVAFLAKPYSPQSFQQVIEGLSSLVVPVAR